MACYVSSETLNCANVLTNNDSGDDDIVFVHDMCAGFPAEFAGLFVDMRALSSLDRRDHVDGPQQTDRPDEKVYRVGQLK